MAGFSVPIFSALNLGQVVAGGSVNVYQTGTTTPVTLYADGGLVTPITNPVTLDQNGEAVFYVSGSVNLRTDYYTAAGGFIKSIDPVYVTNSLTGLTATATQLNYLSGVVTSGVAAASSAIVLDINKNVSGIATNPFGTSSTNIANMASVVGSMTGGFINKFRNGTFDVWQRPLTGQVTAGNSAYTADGWIVGSAGGTTSWTQQGQINGSRFSLQLLGATGVTDSFVKQRIEGFLCQNLINQVCTFQCSILNASLASITPTITVKHAGSLDNWGSPVTDVTAQNLQTIASGATGILCYSFTASVSSANGLEITIDFGAALNTSIKQVFITNCDLRATPGVATGLNNSPPIPELRPYPIELAFCKRYLRGYGVTTGPIASGAATGTTAAGFFIPFEEDMRIAATGLSVTTVADFEIASYAGADVAALSGLAFSQAGPQGLFVTATTAGSLTAAVPYFLYNKTALQGNLLITGAEL